MRYWSGYCYREFNAIAVGPAIDRNTGEAYATGLYRTTDDEHRKNLMPMIKFGCSECAFTWEESDRDDMIMTPDHNSHFTEPCPGSGDIAMIVAQ